jgi:putative redox protein
VDASPDPAAASGAGAPAPGDAPPAREPTVIARVGRTGYRTDIETGGGHVVVADEPVAFGGTDAGPTPYGMIAAALGACTAITLRMYADRKGWPLEGVVVRLWHSRVHARDEEMCETRPARLDELSLDLELAGPLDDAQRARLLDIAHRCPVHRTLAAGIHIRAALAPAAGTRP